MFIVLGTRSGLYIPILAKHRYDVVCCTGPGGADKNGDIGSPGSGGLGDDDNGYIEVM